MLTVTTTPEIIYLLVNILSSNPGDLPFTELYRTEDKVVCETQAADWSNKLAPNKFICVSHNQKIMLEDLDSGGDAIQIFTATIPATPGNKAFLQLFRATDKPICDAQAAEWSTAFAPVKFVCVKHNKGKLQYKSSEDID